MLFCGRLALAAAIAPLPQTTPLTNSGDLSAEMVTGIDRWLMRETDRVAAERDKRWKSINPVELARQREHLRHIIGAVDEIAATPRLEIISADASRTELYRSSGPHAFVAHRVRWPVFEGIYAEGLLLEPIDAAGKPAVPVANVVALPDADQTPEALAGLDSKITPPSQFARHLAESRWRVLVPALVGRDDTFSGNEHLKRFTNQPHREWIYRQAYELGRHIIGYEVASVVAGTRALAEPRQRVALAGYGEGALIALHAAALDTNLAAALVSGYFGGHDQLWREPIYRNVFGYVRDFGDAELVRLVAPRKVIVEFSDAPRVNGPPPTRPGRSGAAPGVLLTPEFGEVEAEVERADDFLKAGNAGAVEFVHGSEGTRVQFGSRKSLAALADALKVTEPISFDVAPLPGAAVDAGAVTNRQRQLVSEFDSFTQTVLRHSEAERNTSFWNYRGGYLADTNEFVKDLPARRDRFWRETIGKFTAPKSPPRPRSRQIYDKPTWTGYEVMLDVAPDIFAWGYLLVPKDLKPGERRPVIVCQHGLEGVPEDTVTEDTQSRGYTFYRAFAARLAERGFIVYAPHNPYRGHDAFRALQRKANPLGLSLFSFIIAQHEVATDWLASLPFVDPARIGFYGLSYGGKTAMRVPAVVERYCLSICSGDFNEWVEKNATSESPYSYLFTGEYEMPEWDLGHTFNYAEMAALIFPRPFMVERGHDDTVAPDTWVAYEYARVRRMYDTFAMGDQTEIEFFNGPHQINGVGTFKFLHRWLRWPEPAGH